MSSETSPELSTQINSLAQRRGLWFQSSDIYGGFAAVYDYGPVGVELANNVKQTWWDEMTLDDSGGIAPVVGLDSAILMSPRVWEASGHVDGFSDPLTECSDCNTRLRVDHLLESVGVTSVDEKSTIDEITDVFHNHKHSIHCTNCGGSDFSEPRQFNLLVTTNVGDFTGEGSDPAYLRGETCQGIYVNYMNIVNTSRIRVPFGVAQIGKAFRNEITARQGLFRTREFEQMEAQFFVSPDQEMEVYEQLRDRRMRYYVETLGINSSKLRWAEHEQLVFYAQAAWDIEFEYPFGFRELEGVHARGNYDLTQHQEASHKKMDYVDTQTGDRFIPHVVESSVGVGRTVLAVVADAYEHEDLPNGKTREVLHLSPKLAPVKAAVIPLKRNDAQMVETANHLRSGLVRSLRKPIGYDDRGNIGKAYRAQDEIGTPYCITVDYETLETQSVTVRDRDTMGQVRVSMDQLDNYLQDGLTATN